MRLPHRPVEARPHIPPLGHAGFTWHKTGSGLEAGSPRIGKLKVAIAVMHGDSGGLVELDCAVYDLFGQQ
jgi:hypothetical protein